MKTTCRGALAIAGALFCSVLSPDSARAQSEPDTATDQQASDVVVMVCLDAPGPEAGPSSDCDWQSLRAARTESPIRPVAVNDRTRPGAVRITGQHDTDAANPQHSRTDKLSMPAIKDILPGLDAGVRQLLIWSLHYQVTPDGSYGWRLDEDNSYRRAQYEALGLARPDRKRLVGHHRFKGAGLRILLRY